MKVSKKLYKIIVIALLIIVFSSCICYADEGLPNIDDEYRPEIEGTKVVNITESILGILIAIGGIAIVIFIALTGFGMILGSADEKAEAQGKFIGYLIAAVVLTSGATIARMIMAVAGDFA